MILCDVGNSRMHFFDGGKPLHLTFDEGLGRYGDEVVYFICVNGKIAPRISKEAPGWIDLSEYRMLHSDYRGLGIDREAACLGAWDGVVIDAGSAITVDVMERGLHKGGWIWPGISSFKEAYAGISPKLAVGIDPGVDITSLPKDTESAVSFAVLAPVKRLVEYFAPQFDITITGGDAHIFAPLFPEAKVDELLVFKGMEKMIKEKRC
ncbi:pantothenate kinase type III, CoaX-like [Hydrogenimonas sp.]|nr:pantothenate kinase type III, CoaX-like [Hydrogenimonas sp.]